MNALQQQNQVVNSETDPFVLKALQGHKEKITSATFHPSLKQVISSSNDGLILAWGLSANARPNKFIGHQGPVCDVAVSPQGTLIASVSRDTTVRIWNNNASAHCTILNGHSAPVKSIEFNQDGSLLVSACDDKLVKVWDVHKRKFRQTLKGHSNWVRTAQFSLDSRMVASGSDDRSIKLWDLSTEQVVNEFYDHAGMVSSVKFHPDGTCLASAASDKKIKIFDVRSQRLLQHYDAHSKGVNSVAFHSNGQFLISTSDDATIKIWDLRKGQIMYTLYGHEGPSTTASFSPLGDFIISGGDDQNLVIWKSNLNPQATEVLHGATAAKVGTDVFITDKAGIKDLPEDKRREEGVLQRKENLQGRINNADGTNVRANPKFGTKPHSSAAAVERAADEKIFGNKAIGPTYNMLKPEVKTCLDKVMYQLDLCKNTLGLLERRISTSESNLTAVMEFIRTEDINYKPYLAQAVVAEHESPEKSSHLYHPHLYKETLTVNTQLLNNYTVAGGVSGEGEQQLRHLPVTTALLAQTPKEQASALYVENKGVSLAVSSIQQRSEPAMQQTGNYDLAELRKKLEQRMEYSKVQSLPHDPAMDPNETIPSYASSTDQPRADESQRYRSMSGRGADSSDDEE